MPSLAATMYRQVLTTVRSVDRKFHGNTDHTFRAIFGLLLNNHIAFPALETATSPATSSQTKSKKGKSASAAGTESANCKSGNPSVELAKFLFRSCAKQQELSKAAWTSESKKVFYILRQCQKVTGTDNATSPANSARAGPGQTVMTVGDTEYTLDESTINLFTDGGETDKKNEPVYLERETSISFVSQDGSTTQIQKHSSQGNTDKLVLRTVLPADGRTFPLPRHSVPTDPVWMLTLQQEGDFPLMREALLLEAAAACINRQRAKQDEKSSGTSLSTFFPFFTSATFEEGSLKQPETFTIKSLFQKWYAQEAVSMETLRNAFLSLPMQSVVQSDGIIEIACRTEYIGITERMPNHRRWEDDDEEDDEDGGAMKKVKGEKAHAFHYFISIRNISGDNGASNREQLTSPPEKRVNPPSEELAEAAKKGCAVTLLSRHLCFFDLEKDHTFEIVGPGVVGKYPTLLPGESYVYASGTTLTGKYGWMRGTYQFALKSEEKREKSASTPEKKSTTTKKGGKSSGDGGSGASQGTKVDEVPNIGMLNAEIGTARFSQTVGAQDLKIVGIAAEKKEASA